MEKFGTKETKDMLCFVLGLANAMGKSLEDKEFTVTDLTNFALPLLDIAKAFAGASDIPMELKDLEDDEKDDLLAYAKDTLDIPQKNIELIIENAFDIIAKIHGIIKLSIK